MKARLIFCLVSILSLLVCQKASAVTFTWKAGSTTWNSSSSWTVGGAATTRYPGDNNNTTDDDVTISVSANITQYILPGVLRNITVNNGATVTITMAPTLVGLIASVFPFSGALTIGSATATTLNFAGTGTVSGSNTSKIELRSLSTLTTAANVTTTVTTTSQALISTNATATFNGRITLSGQMAIIDPGTTVLTTNATGNTITGGFNLRYDGGPGTSFSNLTWNGSGTSTCGSTSNVSVINAKCTFTVGAGNTITFNGNLSMRSNIASGFNPFFENNGIITFAGAALTTDGINSVATLIKNNASTGVITLTGDANSKIELGNNVNLLNAGNIVAASGTNAANGAFINLNGTSSTLTNNGGIVTFNDYASLNLNGNPCTVTNSSGTFNFNANSVLNFSQPNTTFTNNSTVNFTTSTVKLVGSPSTVNNSSAFTLNANSNITLSGQNSSISNTGSGVFKINASTVTLNANPSSITNAGNFQVYGNSFITMGNNAGQTINNSGTFSAGLTNSSCTITLGGPADKINNTGGTFYLGSTSTILPNNVATITNISPAKFILQSDANGSAAIAQIANTSTSFVGIFDVERFFTGGNLIANRGYRLMSSPVHLTTQATSNTSAYNLSFIKNSAFTGGPGGPGSGFSGSSIGPTVYLYKETLPASNTTFTSGKHVGILSIDASTGNMTLSDNSVPALASIPIGNGYLFFFVGSRFLNGGGPRTSGSANATPVSGPPTDATTTTSGYLNQGGFTANLWWNSTGKLSNAATSAPGFNMMGNPYPCTLDLGKVLTQNNTSVDAAYVLSSKTGGTNQNYVAYTDNSLSSSPIGQPNIVSGGGFIVHVKSGALNPVLTFAESQKVSTNLSGPTGSSLIMSTPMTGLLHPASSNLNKKMATSISATLPAVTGLYMKLEQDSTIYDYCGIYFDKDASAKFADRDALNLNATTSRAYMASLSSDGIKTSINSMPDYHASSHIKLYVAASANGRYQLKLEGVRNIDTLYDIFLIDKYKRDSLDIRQYGAYKFDLITSDTTTYGGNRFELSIRRRPLPACQLVAFTGTKNTNNSINIRWKVYNEGNYTGFTLEKQDGGTINYTTLYNKQSDGSSVYTFVDNNPHLGLNIYRLKQNDIDSRIGYSNAVTVDMNSTGKEDNMFSVYPNPTTERINININLLTSPLASSNTYQFNIYNNSGSLIMKRTLASTNLSENVAGLLPGTYIVEVRQANGNLLGKTKFVKVN